MSREVDSRCDQPKKKPKKRKRLEVEDSSEASVATTKLQGTADVALGSYNCNNTKKSVDSSTQLWL